MLSYSEFFTPSPIKRRRRELPMFVVDINPATELSYLECRSECPLDRECANHTTAGDFRSEDGFTPNLKKVNGVWMCSQKETKKRGFLHWKNGKYINYSFD